MTHSIRKLLLGGVAVLATFPALAARRDSGSARQCRQGAAQLVDEPPHLRRAALLAARQDQQGHRQEPQARLRSGDRRHRGQRKSAIDATGRGRLPLHRRSVGGGLQDRRAFGRHGPHRLADGPRTGEAAAVEPGRRAVGESGRLHRQLSSPRDRHRQGHRQGRLGDEPARSARRADHRRAARGQGQDHRGRGRRRPRRARLDRGARRRLRQTDLAQIRHTGAGRARQRDLEGQEQRLADRRRRHVDHGLVRSCDQSGDLGHGQSRADVRSDLSPRRQPLYQQHDLLESRQRQHELVFPVHAGRPLGLRRSPTRTSSSTARSAGSSAS